MNTCLVTKLKSTVDNPDLPKFDELRLEVLPTTLGIYNINIRATESNKIKIYTNSPYIYFTYNGEETQTQEIFVTDTQSTITYPINIHNTSNEPQYIYITNKSYISLLGQTASSPIPNYAFGPNSDKIYMKYLPNLSGLISSVAFEAYNLLQGTILDLNSGPRLRKQLYLWCNSITGTFESYVEKWAPTVDEAYLGIGLANVTFDGKPINSIGNNSMGDGTKWELVNGVYVLKLRGIENAATYNPSAPAGSRWTYTYE